MESETNVLWDPYRKEPIAELVNKPPLVRMGGKRYLADRITAMINATDYSMYVEPFIGGGRIYFEKEPHFEEIIADVEGRIANFLFCCKRFATEMYLAQATLIKDENTFERIYDEYHDPIRLQKIEDRITRATAQYEAGDENAIPILVEEAMKFYFYSNMAFRGSLTARTMTYFENDPRTETNRCRYRIYRPIFWMAERMRRTQVLHKDFEKTFEIALKYQNHTRIWVLDPPYPETEGYEHAWTWEDMARLNECLKRIPRTDYFIFTMKRSSKAYRLFSWCWRRSVATHYTTGGAGQCKEVKEWIITPPWHPKKKAGLGKWIK